MTYRDGVVWAGANDLWKSTNTGRTWTKTAMPASRVYDISAYDDSVVAVATLDRGTLLSTDQGTTWRDIHGRSATKVTFGNDAFTIIAQSSSEFVRTTDRGTTWSTMTPLFTGASFRSRGSTIYHIGDRQMHVSNDDGATWTVNPGQFDRDCYDFALDSCQPETMYVVNEELYLLDDAKPAIYVTTNTGGSWQVTTPFNGYCGNVASSVAQVFVQTLQTGTIASADHGVTWTNIGGPVGSPDQTLISVVEDSILLVADTAGAIWRTPITSIRRPGVTPFSLFASDTISLCSDPIARPVAIRTGCARIDSVTISDQSMGYRVDSIIRRGGTGLDTAIISFKPNREGSFPTSATVYLDDGQTLTLALQGTGLAAQMARLGERSIVATAIGEDLAVPIALTNATATARVHVTADYDTSLLSYQFTKLTDGAKVADVIEAPAGHLGIDLDVAAPSDDTVAYIFFRWFPQSASKTVVTLDSLSVDAATGHCVFAVNEPVQIPIEGSDDCANPYLSTFLRYGARSIILVPNPAREGTVSITGLPAGIPVTVTIANEVGRTVARFTRTSKANGTIDLAADNLSEGVYEVTCVTYEVSERPTIRRAALVIRH